MTERELLGQVMRLAGQHPRLLWHHCGDSRRCYGDEGLPDLIIAGTGGILFAELKSDLGQTSAAQDLWQWQIANGPGVAMPRIWRPAQLEDGTIERALKMLA